MEKLEKSRFRHGLEDFPMIKKALELRKQNKLSKEQWIKEFKDFREKESDKEWEDILWDAYLVSKPKYILNFLIFKVIDYFQTEENKSIRQIAEELGMSKNKVSRVLVGIDKGMKPSMKDMALWQNVSVSTVRRVIKEHKREQKEKAQQKLG